MEHNMESQIHNVNAQAAGATASVGSMGAMLFGLPQEWFTSALGIKIDPAPVLRDLAQGVLKHESQARLAGRFHHAVAVMVSDVCASIATATGLRDVALSGGVFQNVLLLELSVNRLTSDGFRVLTHRVVPANDGGLALGQAAVAWAAQAQRRGDSKGI